MNKKYRLKIIYPINEELFAMVEDFRRDKLDGKIINSRENNINFIPKSWLAEIKEPLTHNEWFDKENPDFPSDSFDWNKDQNDKYTSTSHTWESCLENKKLSSELKKENFKEWFHSKEVEKLAYHFNDRDAAENICKAWVDYITK